MKQLMVVLVVGCAMLSVAASDVKVGAGERYSVRTDTTVVQQSSVAVDPEGCLDKVGLASWTLPLRMITQLNGFELGVRDGCVVLEDSSALPADVIPSALENDAFMWLDAGVNVRTDEVTGGALAWNDHRESVSSAPFAHYGATAQSIPNGGSFVPPAVVDRYGRKMLYFNGSGSGSWMQFEKGDRTGAAQQLSGVRHMFFVVDFDQSYTFLLGGINCYDLKIGSGGTKMTLDQTYWSPTDCNSEAVYQAKMYLNGDRIDGTTTTVRKGLQILELEFGGKCPRVFSLFNANNVWSSALKWIGGDYLGEVIFFDRPLTAAERLDVNAYLARKWFGAASPESIRLAVAMNAAVEADVAAGDQIAMSLSGRGSVVKKGEGVLVVDQASAAGFAGSISVAQGAVKTENPSLPYGFVSGKGVKVETDSLAGLTLSATAAPSGTAEKSGSGEVRASEIPSAVSALEVKEGSLTLTGADLADPVIEGGSETLATIPNASFEEYAGNQMKQFAENETYLGWTGENRYVRYLSPLNMPDWMKAEPYAPYPAPDGSVVMILENGGCIHTTVTFPRAGDYELTFLTTTRSYTSGHDDKMEGTPIDLQLIRNGETNTFAHLCVFRNDGFRKHRFLIRNVQADDYVFRLRNLQAGVDGASGSSNFDDFKMTYVSRRANEKTVQVPNGDFEFTDFTYANYADFTATPSPVGWTLTQAGTGGQGGMPDVGPISYGCGQLYNAASARYGNVQLLFCSNGGSAESVPFKIAPGRYQLRFRGGRWGFASSWNWHGVSLTATPVLAAEITVGAKKTALTSQTVGWNVFKPVVFPEVFEVGSAAETVGVKLWQTVAAAGLLVDDLELVRLSDDGNLVKNGGLEKTDGWAFDTSGGTARQYHYSWSPANFGYSRYEGDYYLMIGQSGAASQEVDFPEAGTYRMTLHACGRADNAAYRNNALKLWWENGGVEHVIAKTPGILSTEFVTYSYLFNIPAKGKFRVGIAGTVTQDKTARVDGISITRALNESDVPTAREDISIDVASGAKLRLDFSGTMNAGLFKIGGRRHSGVINEERFPDYLSGPGSIYVKPTGLSIIVR